MPETKRWHRAAVVYRERAQDIERVERNEDPDQSLIAFGARGQRGNDGARGYDGADGSGYGGYGQDAGDAGPAQRGWDGGRIRVTLERGPGDGLMLARGERRDVSGRGTHIDDRIEMGDRGYLDLSVRGGDGGHGGDGGCGGDGARGSSGSNATRYSSGGDGGRGGDGGNGGNATGGADGGNGGRITVEVSDDNTPLLMLVRPDVSGGAGGKHGNNGAGGSGGSGGPGGSSYSWTETESYTDSQGNRQTRTKFRSNSGGSRGPSGSSGRAGAAIVYHGDDGSPGHFEIVVRGPDGEISYPSCFDLKLVGFRHHSDNADGVYEPGERVHVVDLEVENTGGMPTPAHHDVELTLQQLGWVLPEDEKLLLPRSLGPGQRHQFHPSEALHFAIGEYEPRSPDAPLDCPEMIRQRATLPDVRRDFRWYEGRVSEEAGAFVISFPLQSSRLSSLNALAPGEAAHIRWSIRNQSMLAFGRGSEGQRRVRFRLHTHHSELGDAHAVLLDQREQRVPLDSGWLVELERIEPGEEKHFEATIGFCDDAPHYRRLGLWLTLEIGRIEAPDTLRVAQIAGFDARVAQRYQPQSGSEILLVVNHRTQREEVDAWRALASELGIAVDVWDLSLEGGLDLERDLGGGLSLRDDLVGKTLVLLNNAVQTPSGKEVTAMRYVDKEQLLAAADAGVGVALVGRDVGVARLLTPTSVTADEGGEGPHGDGVDEDPEASERLLGPYLGELAERDSEAQSPLRHRLDVVSWSLLGGGADTRALTTAAQKLSRALTARYPGQRYVVVESIEPRLTRSVLWMKRWRVGTVELRAMLPVQAGPLLSAEVQDEVLHDPRFVQSDDNLMLMWLTRSFEDKLERLDDLLSAEDEDGPGRDQAGRSRVDRLGLLVDAMLVDLAHEQRAVLEIRSRAGLSDRLLRARTPLLQQLAAFRPTCSRRIAPDCPMGCQLVRLVARLRASAAARMRWWEWLPPLPWIQRAPRLRRLIHRLTGQLLRALIAGTGPLDALGKSDWAGANKALVSEAREIEDDYASYRAEQLAETGINVTEEDFADALLLGPIHNRGITTGAEVLATWPERILQRDEVIELEARDQRRATRRGKLLAGAERAAAELKRDETTAQLLG